MRGWAALMRTLGMSLRSASDTLAAFGEFLSRASVRRDVQEAGENARRSLAERAPGQARAVGEDETHARGEGREKGHLHSRGRPNRADSGAGGDSGGRPEHVQASCRASGIGGSCSGRRGPKPSPPARGVERQAAGAVMLPLAGGVPWTDNMAERAIGSSKIRHKTVTGCKSESGLLNGFGPTRRAWSGSDCLECCRIWSRRKTSHPPRGIAPSETRPDFPNRICDGYETRRG